MTNTFSGALRTLAGIVDHQRLRMDTLKQMRGRDICKIEGRVLAQEYDVEFREGRSPRLVQREMVAGLVADAEGLDVGEHLAIEQCQPVGRVISKLDGLRFCASSSRAKVELPLMLIRSIGSICTAILRLMAPFRRIKR